MIRNVKLLHESRCNRTAMLNPRCKGPRDYLEALTRRVSRTQIVFFLARLDCWSVRRPRRISWQSGGKGKLHCVQTGKSRLHSCYKVIFYYNCLQIRFVFDRPERLVAQNFNLVQESFAEDWT